MDGGGSSTAAAVVDAQEALGSAGSGAGDLFAGIREHTDALAVHELARVQTIARWAARHAVASVEEGAATVRDGRVDTGVPVAGPGAPLVSQYAVVELSALLGRCYDSGCGYLGGIVELAFRLPQLWAAVAQRRVPVWKALVIADHTKPLSRDAAGHVDRHLARFAAGASWAQVDRLVEEALVRFDPEAAEQQRRRAEEARHFTVHTDQAGHDGTIAVSGVLDAADALDLDTAVGREAEQLARLGDQDTLDVRRAKAVGQVARRDLTLHYTTGDDHDDDTATPTASPTPRPAGRPTGRPAGNPGRTVDLHVHLSQAAVEATDPVGRLGNTETPISPQTIKDWCRAPGTTVIVRPVLDVAGHEPTAAYEIRDRQRRQVQLREHRCAFPFCTRRASRCDLDHATPHAAGGPTCPCNLVPLCRTHHRAKTHTGWSYLVLHPGCYLWTSPHHHQWLVDHHGTRPLEQPQPCHHTDPPDT